MAEMSGETAAAETTENAPNRATRWRGGIRLYTHHEVYWWIEIGIVLIFDLVYESVRNLNQSGAQHAYENALRVIDWQKAVGLYHEEAMQQWALHYEWLIVAANYFYGSAYILVTASALIFLYRRAPDDYPLWRNTLLIGTLLGLIGFATFPLMPPRLLDTIAGHDAYGYVDTLVKYRTFWSFDSEAMKSISNQYAAMPSLHCGWSLWGCAVFLPRVRSWWAKALAIAYPVVTTLVVIITANHYLLDAVGGAIIFAIGYLIARLITKAGRADHPTRAKDADERHESLLLNAP
ncbi:MAG: phosphatase PAP2 family protein [Actinomycetes bacterium]